MSEDIEEFVARCHKSDVPREDLEASLIESGWKQDAFGYFVDKYYGAKSRRQAAAMATPVHRYVMPPPCPWPRSAIMQKESEKTYCMLDSLAQSMDIAGAVLVYGLIIIFALALLLPIAMVGGIGPTALVIICGLAFLAPNLIMSGLEIAYMLSTHRFSLQEEYIFVRHGVISPSYHMIPYENVQDAQVTQGILDRYFNLATVVISTPASSIRINPLPFDVANKFRQDVLTISKLHKGMAE